MMEDKKFCESSDMHRSVAMVGHTAVVVSEGMQ